MHFSSSEARLFQALTHGSMMASSGLAVGSASGFPSMITEVFLYQAFLAIGAALSHSGWASSYAPSDLGLLNSVASVILLHVRLQTSFAFAPPVRHSLVKVAVIRVPGSAPSAECLRTLDRFERTGGCFGCFTASEGV